MAYQNASIKPTIGDLAVVEVEVAGAAFLDSDVALLRAGGCPLEILVEASQFMFLN